MDWTKKTITLAGIFLVIDGFAASSGYFPFEAMKAVQVGLPAGHQPSNSQCTGCHQQEFQDWSKSRHSQAFSNQNFQEGYFREPQERCLNCHTPLQEQVTEIKTSPKLGLAHEGVNCVACHVRDGQVQSSKSSGDSYHGYVENNFLKSPQFCASCHEFNVNGSTNGQVHLTNTNAQSTYREWQNYQAAGGTRTCQNCHMPDGRHVFQGAHGRQTTPLKVVAKPRGSSTVLELSTQEIGHNFPSGDVFRRVTLEVRASAAQSFTTVETFGRRYGDVGGFRLLSNTSLRPFEKREVEVSTPRPFHYRLTYHFMKDQDKINSQTLPAERERLLQQGTIGDL